MTDFPMLFNGAQLFPGELDAIEAEFCGHTARPLAMLPPAKLARLREYFKHPTEARQAAFDQVKTWAGSPIAAAADLLKNPAKYQPKAKPTQQDRNVSVLAAWLEEEGEL